MGDFLHFLTFHFQTPSKEKQVEEEEEEELHRSDRESVVSAGNLFEGENQTELSYRTPE